MFLVKLFYNKLYIGSLLHLMVAFSISLLSIMFGILCSADGALGGG